MSTPSLWLHGWAADTTIWPKELLPPTACAIYWKTPDISPIVAQLRRLHQTTGQAVVVVGWSTGGMLALELAQHYPQGIAQLILISSTARFTQTAGYPAGLPAAAVHQLSRRLARDAASTLSAFYRSLFPAAEEMAAAPFLSDRVPDLVTRLDPIALQHGLQYLLQQDLRAALSALRIPTLVLHGEADTVCPLAAGQFLAATLPQARLFTLPTAGHAPFMTQTAAVQRILVQEAMFI